MNVNAKKDSNSEETRKHALVTLLYFFSVLPSFHHYYNWPYINIVSHKPIKNYNGVGWFNLRMSVLVTILFLIKSNNILKKE